MKEKKKKTFVPNPNSVRDYADPLPASDCRCGFTCDTCLLDAGNCTIKPWVAMSSAENWGDDCLGPDGNADGDVRDPLRDYVPIEELAAADIHGRPIFNFDGTILYPEGDDEDLDEEVYQMLWRDELLAEERRMFLGETAEDEEVPVVAYPEPSTEPFFRHKEEKAVVTVGGVRFAEPHPLEALPSREGTGVISSKMDSRKDARTCTKRGSHSHGWRGTDKYKDRRRRAQQVVEF